MIRSSILITALLLSSLNLTATAEVGVYVKAHTIGRYDWDTNGQRTREPESTYNDAALKLPFSYDDAGDWFDTGTNGNDSTQGTAGIRPAFTPDFGGAYDFDGADDEIQADGMQAVLDGATAFSLVCWVQPDNTSTVSRIFGKWGGSDRKIAWFRHSTGKLAIQVSDDGGGPPLISSTASLTTNWNHVVSTFDAGAIVHYVGGAASGGGATDSSVHTHASEYLLGFVTSGSPATRHWDGHLDDFRVYTRVLTATEVGNIYSNTVGVHP